MTQLVITNQKGFASIIFIIALVVILAGGLGYIELTQKSNTEPITSSTTEQTSAQQQPITESNVVENSKKQNVPAYKPGPSDEKIESLIRSSNLTEIQPVNVFVYLPENKVKVFEVKYGPAQDCESGCFYSKAVGIEYDNKIGWITAHGSDIEKYNFDQNDLYLYVDEFFKLFQSRNSRIYSNEFLSMLIADKDVPEQIKTKAQSFIDYDRKNI